jgi:hypothetical protein
MGVFRAHGPPRVACSLTSPVRIRQPHGRWPSHFSAACLRYSPSQKLPLRSMPKRTQQPLGFASPRQRSPASTRLSLAPHGHEHCRCYKLWLASPHLATRICQFAASRRTPCLSEPHRCGDHMSSRWRAADNIGAVTMPYRAARHTRRWLGSGWSLDAEPDAARIATRTPARPLARRRSMCYMA